MTTLKARNLTLKDVHHLLGFQKQYSDSFTSLLHCDRISEIERQELTEIRNYFDYYLTEGKASEGQVKLVAIAPLLKLAGFYQYPIQIDVEEDIDRIHIEDEDTSIVGRFDILAVNCDRATTPNTFLWILLIETKKGLADPLAGLPQLLTYAHQSLDCQEAVWGLTTNGIRYQFAYLQAGSPPIYQLLPTLNLFETEGAIQLLQVLKAIRNIE